MEGGPKRIAKEIIDILRQILSQKDVFVKVTSKVEYADELAFYWPVYGSLIFHILFWSLNHSESGFSIAIEIETQTM